VKRLDLFKKLHELETMKSELENLRNDVSDYYCNGVEISALLDTSAFADKRKYLGSQRISVNKTRFIGYLNQEIEGIDVEITSLLRELEN
jgi:hypothetical protein